MGFVEDWCLTNTDDSNGIGEHRHQSEEINFYMAVSSGDVAYVKQNIRDGRFAANEGVGVLSRDPVQNLKYHFVVSTALITRICIERGLDFELSFRMSDYYIRKLDDIHTTKDVVKLHADMVLDYTNRMKKGAVRPVTTPPITQCLSYIYSHTSERITVNDLAELTGMSPSYLSRLFKKETGESVSDYIRDQKLEQAKQLLRYTEHSMVEITNMLAFSSQSHFIQRFKDAYGLTPNKYRNKYIYKVFDGLYEQEETTAD